MYYVTGIKRANSSFNPSKNPVEELVYTVDTLADAREYAIHVSHMYTRFMLQSRIYDASKKLVGIVWGDLEIGCPNIYYKVDGKIKRNVRYPCWNILVGGRLGKKRKAEELYSDNPTADIYLFPQK